MMTEENSITEMEKLLKNILTGEELAVLKKIIESRGKLEGEY